MKLTVDVKWTRGT